MPSSCGICFLCYNTTTRRPMTCMPCSHTFCKKCLDEMLKLHATSLKCPTCRTQISNQAPNFELINELNSRRLQRNSSNISNNESTSKTNNQSIPLIKRNKANTPNANLNNSKVKKNNLKYKLALIGLAIVLVLLLVIIIALAINMLVIHKTPSSLSEDISIYLDIFTQSTISSKQTKNVNLSLSSTTFMPKILSPGSLVFNLVGHFNSKQSLVKIEEDESIIASCSHDTIIIWNLTDGSIAFNLTGHNGSIRGNYIEYRCSKSLTCKITHLFYYCVSFAFNRKQKVSFGF